MNKLKLFTIGGVVCAAISISTAPVKAQWPTFDVAEVTNTIQGISTQAQSAMSTVQSTLSVSQMREAIGDNVGSISKFSDDAEKAEKARRKAEKKRKRLERFNRLKSNYDKAKDWYDEGGKDVIEEGMDFLSGGDSSSQTAAAAPSLPTQGEYNIQNSEGNANNSASNRRGSDTQGSVTKPTRGEYNIQNSEGNANNSVSNRRGSDTQDAVANNLIEVEEDNFAELVADKEFSEGSWNGEDFTAASEAKLEISPATPIAAPEISIGRRPFVGEVPAVGQYKAGTSEATVPEISIGRRPFVGEVPAVGQYEVRTGKAATTTLSVDNQTVTADPSVTLPAEAKPNGNKKVLPRINPAVEKKLPARKAFKTMKVSMKMDSSLAFAQQSSFKTGTNEDGKFIFSDEIANKCGMNYDKFGEDDVTNCVKTFVMGMNHDNAQEAQEWRKVYENSLHDHYTADLATAMLQKGY